MNNAIFLKKPPEKYIENFVEYVPGVDTMPTYFDFLIHGFKPKDAERMCTLLNIESLKYHFEEVKVDYDPTEEEIKEYESLIAGEIAKYNEAS